MDLSRVAAQKSGRVVAAKLVLDEAAALILLLPRKTGPEDEETLAAGRAADIVAVVGTLAKNLVHIELLGCKSKDAIVPHMPGP